MKPLRVCAETGCPTMTSGSTCEVHQQAPRQDTRPNAGKRGYDARWQAYSTAYRKRHPWCRQCQKEGRRRKAQLVDHIQPVTSRQDPGFMDPANHQPLCRNCHSVKTHQEGKTATPKAPAPWFIA